MSCEQPEEKNEENSDNGTAVSPVSPCIQRQLRVGRRIHEQMDSAEKQEQSQTGSTRKNRAPL
jgi:hypothetical protein